MTFTYERRGETFELPFDPTAEGFEYSHCQCSFVKFKRMIGDKETQLGFYPDKKKISVDYITHKEKHFVRENSKYILRYPMNQNDLRKILMEENV